MLGQWRTEQEMRGRRGVKSVSRALAVALYHLASPPSSVSLQVQVTFPGPRPFGPRREGVTRPTVTILALSFVVSLQLRK